MIEFPIYSPEEEIKHPLLTDKNVRLFIKRDDMIHPFISGNKWRKLKYNIIEATRLGKSHLVTFGGVWSNHLLATACAAAKFGVKATAFVRGEDVETDSLFLCKMFGMNLIFTDRRAYRDKRALFDLHFSNDPTAYFVDEGGAGELAVKGCAELVAELKEEYNHLFCAAGTGTTAAGILRGINTHALGATLHVVPVLKGASFLQKDVEQLSGVPASFNFHEDYHFGGYAKTTPPLLSFISDFTAATGILLDQVYTGKMMFAIFDLIRQDYFQRGERILAVHTGGLFGLLGLKTQAKQ